LLIPYSLRKVEQAILDEFKASNLKVCFSINDYDFDKKSIKYVLVSVEEPTKIPEEAKRIVEKTLNRWKATYSNYVNAPIRQNLL